jgi:hypothetical protein
MNTALQEQIRQVRFAAFVSGNNDLCEFLNTATWTEPFWRTDTTYLEDSKWLDDRYQEQCDLDSGEPGDYTDYCRRQRGIRESNARITQVVRAGRRCGIIFHHGRIENARIPLKP